MAPATAEAGFDYTLAKVPYVMLAVSLAHPEWSEDDLRRQCIHLRNQCLARNPNQARLGIIDDLDPRVIDRLIRLVGYCFPDMTRDQLDDWRRTVALSVLGNLCRGQPKSVSLKYVFQARIANPKLPEEVIKEACGRILRMNGDADDFGSEDARWPYELELANLDQFMRVWEYLTPHASPADLQFLEDHLTRFLGFQTKSILIDCQSDNETLMFVFGGLNGRKNSGWEFLTIMSMFDLKKIFVKDVHCAWYHKGLPGICDDFEGVIAHLKDLAAAENPSRVISIGLSGGGYMALAAGILMDVDEIHSFSPQTVIGNKMISEYGDARFLHGVKRLRSVPDVPEERLDLRLLLESRSYRTVVNIHVCEDAPEDVVLAQRLADLPRVRLHRYPSGGHNVARMLRDSGRLEAIFSRYGARPDSSGFDRLSDASRWR